MNKQSELDKRYIRMASIWAENSYCQRRKVGALIVKDKMINLAHSMQGEAVTYMVAPSLLLLERAILVMAFASAWSTYGFVTLFSSSQMFSKMRPLMKGMKEIYTSISNMKKRHSALHSHPKDKTIRQ